MFSQRVHRTVNHFLLKYLMTNIHLFFLSLNTAKKSIVDNLRKVRKWIFRFIWVKVIQICQTIFYSVRYHFISVSIVYEVWSIGKSVCYFEDTVANIFWYSRSRQPVLFCFQAQFFILFQSNIKVGITDVVIIFFHIKPNVIVIRYYTKQSTISKIKYFIKILRDSFTF